MYSWINPDKILVKGILSLWNQSNSNWQTKVIYNPLSVPTNVMRTTANKAYIHQWNGQSLLNWTPNSKRALLLLNYANKMVKIQIHRARVVLTISIVMDIRMELLKLKNSQKYPPLAHRKIFYNLLYRLNRWAKIWKI